MSVEKIIVLAKEEVGYLEKASNRQLDSKTANAGSNNYTKYARDLYAAGYYNGNKNGYAWCDVFVDWLFFKVYGKSEGQRIQCQTGMYGAGCAFSAQYYNAQGRLDKSPKVGDQIFFTDTRGEICHTGIVYAVSSSRVYTIEGNTSSAAGVVANGGAVAMKSYSRSYNRIYGYGHPKYEAEAESETIVNTNENKEEFEVAKTYKNGSTSEPVFADTSKKIKIGSLNPYESCECVGTVGGMYIVKYRVDGTSTYKVGLVSYHGGLA